MAKQLQLHDESEYVEGRAIVVRIAKTFIGSWRLRNKSVPMMAIALDLMFVRRRVSHIGHVVFVAPVNALPVALGIADPVVVCATFVGPVSMTVPSLSAEIVAVLGNDVSVSQVMAQYTTAGMENRRGASAQNEPVGKVGGSAFAIA